MPSGLFQTYIFCSITAEQSALFYAYFAKRGDYCILRCEQTARKGDELFLVLSLLLQFTPAAHTCIISRIFLFFISVCRCEKLAVLWLFYTKTFTALSFSQHPRASVAAAHKNIKIYAPEKTFWEQNK